MQRLEPDTTPPCHEAEQHVDRQIGLLIADDSTLDTPYAHTIELVHRHWSGKHHQVVSGINLLTLLWSDGTDAIPCDDRLFDTPVDGLTKNAHVRALLRRPKHVALHRAHESTQHQRWMNRVPRTTLGSA